MLALSLGMAWLLLAPLALWLLVRGTGGERVTAIVTLVLLEAGTIVMSSAAHPPAPPPAAAAHVAPQPCAARTPVPTSATVSKELVLSWAAAPHECATADVVVRTHGRKVLVWLHEGPTAGTHRPVLTLPVDVKGHTAALKVPLKEKSGYVLVDGRTGRRIPLSAPI
ncbi:hypothetical protein ABZ897_42285 [Nonomuraea sp. NPDC046802]|uniref:hypothetical protein n=1 Tax=Nonomuraea sp. NPDC046802 TaxID=3154919 RepID=UPI0033E59272